jgi:hypothetical protein
VNTKEHIIGNHRKIFIIRRGKMIRKRYLLVMYCLPILLLFASGTAWGQPEPPYKEINYSKYVDIKCNPCIFKFSLFNDLNEPVWMEEGVEIELDRKYVNHYLGSIKSLEGVDFSQQMWVQTEVRSDEEEDYEIVGERDQLEMVPYSFYADSVGSVDWTEVTNIPAGFADGTDDGITAETDPVFGASTAADMTGTDVSNWNTAYGWGNHSLAGYLTSETDPVYSGSPASGISSGQITNWGAAYGWGNHGTVGYDTTNDSWTGTTNVTTFGNVGIGTSSPSKELEVISKGGGGGIKIYGDASTGTHDSPGFTLGGIDISGINREGVLGLSLSDGHFSMNAARGDLVLRAKDKNIHFSTQSGGYPAKMTISSKGNFGIGTTNPFSKMDIRERYATTTLTDDPLLPSATTVNVSSTADFPPSGTLIINREAMYFTGISGNSFTGVTRGLLGSGAWDHSFGSTVVLATQIITESDDTVPQIVMTSAGTMGIGHMPLGYDTLSIFSTEGPAKVHIQSAVSQNESILSFNVGGATSWEIVYDNLDDRKLKFIKRSSPNIETMTLDGDNVGIGTTSPQGKLDVNGSIYQRGSVLHADYVFEPDYQLESIEEHSQYMWRNKHLKAIPKAVVDENGYEIVEVGSHRKGIVEELEKAHIYIEQLHKQIKELEERLVKLETREYVGK